MTGSRNRDVLDDNVASTLCRANLLQGSKAGYSSGCGGIRVA